MVRRFDRTATAAVKLRVYDKWDRRSGILHLEREDDDEDDDASDGYLIRRLGSTTILARVYVVPRSILRRLQGNARQKKEGMEFPTDFPAGEKTIVVGTDYEYEDYLYGTDLAMLLRYALHKFRVGTNQWAISTQQGKALSHMR